MIVAQILIVVSCAAGAVLGQSSCETDRLNAVKNGKQVPQGVNLGSWFVLEGWITPHLWNDNGCDQGSSPGSYLLEKCLGSRAQSVMEKHWSTWITENDFAEMSRRGINLVRIPVGWWHVRIFLRVSNIIFGKRNIKFVIIVDLRSPRRSGQRRFKLVHRPQRFCSRRSDLSR